MKNTMYLVGILVVAFALQGCMAGYHGMYEKRDEPAQPTHQMTVKDVITMSQEGVSDSLVIAQIYATRSVFTLSTQDILDLQKAGVSDSVIQTMINSGNEHAYANKPINTISEEPDSWVYYPYWPYWACYDPYYYPFWSVGFTYYYYPHFYSSHIYYPHSYFRGYGGFGFGGHFGRGRR